MRFKVTVSFTDRITFDFDAPEGTSVDQIKAYISGLGEGVPDGLLDKAEADGAAWVKGSPEVSVDVPLIEDHSEPAKPKPKKKRAAKPKASPPKKDTGIES